MKHLRRSTAVLILALLIRADSISATEPARLRVALQWLPQSQFAGFYIAREQGFYTAAGLDVVLIHTGPGPSSLDFLTSDRSDFATLFLADAIVHAKDDPPLALVAQLVRRSNLMLVGWKDMGIETPADLDGRKVSFWPGAFSTSYTAFFRQHGLRPDILPQHYSVNLFLQRGVAACAAMFYNEFHRIYQSGIDYDQLTVFMMRDYGLGFQEDGLYTTADFAARHPEKCMALRRATLSGWNYARRHREETVDVVLREARKAGVPANRTHSRWMLDHILDSIFPSDDDGEPGVLDKKAYKKTVDALIAAGLIEKAPEFNCYAPFSGNKP